VKTSRHKSATKIRSATDGNTQYFHVEEEVT
jgi:hypothetical protein